VFRQDDDQSCRAVRHLVARKTFKGMTDEMLAWQTERFCELEVADDGWMVTLRPAAEADTIETVRALLP